jgi:hypothetical protein
MATRQTTQSAQQTGFARAVVPLQMQRLTGLQIKRQGREQRPSLALDAELIHAKQRGTHNK